MLEYLRNAADKPLAKVLIGILAFSFVGWGVAEWIFGSVAGDDTLVRVGDVEISIQDFSTEKSHQLALMSKDEQRAVYADPGMMEQLNNDVLSKLTTQAMADNRAMDLGFVVSDAQIAREIRAYPEFQSNGEFSTLMFDNVLASSGYSEAMFADVLRKDVLRGYVLGATSVPMPVPDFAVAATYDARYSERQIDYATVEYDEFDVGAPTEEQLRAFYEQNPHVVPEQRTVSYVLIPADMDEPDKYDEAYENAILVEDDIIAGESMADSAKKHNAKYVALGTFDVDHRPVDDLLTDNMMARIFDMEEGLESELIETKKGFVIIRVDQVVPAHNAEFDSVRSELVDGWTRAEQRKQAYVRANELLVDLNETGKLDGKKTVVAKRASGAPLDVLSTAFNSEVGTNTIVDGSDAFYVLHVEREIMPDTDEKKMADIRKELEKSINPLLMDDYNAFLIREYPVKVNEKLFNRFFAK